jgi:hypothetical protein
MTEMKDELYTDSIQRRIDMGFTDIFWMALIIIGTVYLLYRSLWIKKGHCQGCDSGVCDAGKKSDYGSADNRRQYL